MFYLNLSGVEKALYQSKYVRRCIWELHNILYRSLFGVLLEISLVELRAIAQKVFLNSKRLLIGTYKDYDEYGMWLT